MRRKKLTERTLRRRNRRFHGYNFLFFLTLCVLGACLLLYEEALLAEYESVQPYHLVQSLFDEIASGNYRQLYAFEDPNALNGSTEEQYGQFLSERIGSTTLTWAKAYSSEPDVRKYNVKSNGTSIATFTLRETDEKSAHGFAQWAVDHIDTGFIAPRTYRIRALESAVVMVNGVPLGEADRVQSGIKTAYSGHLIDEAAPQLECIYETTHVMGTPEITAIDAAGRPQVVTEVDGVWVAARNYDDASLDGPYRTGALVVTKEICKYVVGLGQLNTARAYMVENSKARAILETYALWKSTPARRGRFENMVVENYVRLSEHSFCCEVRGDYICSYQTQDDQTYTLNYTLYFYNKNGDATNDWKLYDFTSF